MAKVKFNVENNTYKLKVDSAQMQIIAKLLSHVVLDSSPVGQAAHGIMTAIEDSECADMLDLNNPGVVAFRQDDATGEKIIMIPDEHLCLEFSVNAPRAWA